MEYSSQLLHHFVNPCNTGEIPDPDGTGVAGNPACGDFLKVTIRVKDNILTEVRFLCRGCPAAIGTTSAMTVLVKGMNVGDASEITEEAVLKEVEGLPEEKQHCSLLAVQGLQNAILDWILKGSSTVNLT